MNRIEKLIEELCPDGVEYLTLGELGKFYGGLKGKSKQDFSHGLGRYVTYKSIYKNIAVIQDEAEHVHVEEGENQLTLQYGDVLFTGSSENLEEVGLSSVVCSKNDFPLFLNSFSICFRLNKNSLLNPNFSKYLFRSNSLRKQIKKTANGVTRINVSKKLLAKVLIPLPPLAIQEEIVKILDSFTLLEAELEAELEARRKQYQYYRNELLNFRERERVKFFLVGSICDIKRGRVISKSFLRENQGKYPVYSSQTFNDGVFGMISSYDFDGEYITWTTDGANAGTVVPRNGKFSCTNVCGLLKVTDNEVNSKYLAYILGSVAKKYVNTGMGNPKLMSNQMASIVVPVPPLEEQARIVAVLDRFDALVNDISSGLPAEIAARRKQYEYYRDKLLTFPEKKTT